MKKCGVNMLARCRIVLMDKCCKDYIKLHEWRDFLLISIFRKGSKKEPGCYGKLSIICSMSKFFGKILQSKLRKRFGHDLVEEQTGFTQGKLREDKLFILQQLMEKKTRKITKLSCS